MWLRYPELLWQVLRLLSTSKPDFTTAAIQQREGRTAVTASIMKNRKQIFCLFAYHRPTS